MTESNTGGNQTSASDLRSALERAQAENKTLKSENETLVADAAATNRSKVFDDAGIGAEKLGGMFRSGYDGDLTVEAVKAKALEFGLISDGASGGSGSGPVVEEPSSGVPAAEQQGLADIAGLQTAGTVDTTGQAALAAQIAGATSSEDLNRIMAQAGQSSTR